MDVFYSLSFLLLCERQKEAVIIPEKEKISVKATVESESCRIDHIFLHGWDRYYLDLHYMVGTQIFCTYFTYVEGEYLLRTTQLYSMYFIIPSIIGKFVVSTIVFLGLNENKAKNSISLWLCLQEFLPCYLCFSSVPKNHRLFLCTLISGPTSRFFSGFYNTAILMSIIPDCVADYGECGKLDLEMMVFSMHLFHFRNKIGLAVRK